MCGHEYTYMARQQPPDDGGNPERDTVLFSRERNAKYFKLGGQKPCESGNGRSGIPGSGRHRAGGDVGRHQAAATAASVQMI